MSVVIDASAAMSWFFENERTTVSDALLDRVVNESATVPELWRLETANVLQMAVRQKRITAAFRDQAIQRLGKLPIRTDHETSARAWTSTLQLSEQYELTVYDAAYLELAIRLGLPLASKDEELRKAAAKANVAVIAA